MSKKFFNKGKSNPMGKYKSGNLFIVYFNKYGTRLHKNLVNDYMDGMSEIKAHLEENPDCSCILERVIYNSKDTNKHGITE